jgi:hypothetical protein
MNTSNSFYLLFVISITIACSFTSKLAHAGEPEGTVDFTRDIRPILSENCFHCHGPDKKHLKAKLRLDIKDSVFKDRDGNAAVVSGSLEKSELWHLITTDDKEEQMPPIKSGKKLKPFEKQLIKQWIEQGAPWAGHWAYQTPTRPALPKIKQTNWPRNPIDYFVLSRMENKKARAGNRSKPPHLDTPGNFRPDRVTANCRSNSRVCRRQIAYSIRNCC